MWQSSCGAAFLSFAFLCACEEKKEAVHTDAGAAKNPQGAVIDSKLEKALAAAAGSAAPGAQDQQGPPPNGVFAPGSADARHAAGAPTKIEMGSDGAEPRITLAPSGLPTGTAKTQIAMELGQGAVPVLEFGLTFNKPKPDAPAGVVVLAKNVGLAPANLQPGKIPTEAEKEIAKIAGSEIGFQMGADGKISRITQQMSKAAGQDIFEDALNSAAEAVYYGTVPTPPKPVGVGAYWVAEDRGTWHDVDVVSYRGYRVKAIDGDVVTLALDVRQYATTRAFSLPGTPPGSTLEQFQSVAQGEMKVKKTDLVAHHLEAAHEMMLGFKPPPGSMPNPPPQQPGQPPGQALLRAQMRIQLRLDRPTTAAPTAPAK